MFFFGLFLDFLLKVPKNAIIGRGSKPQTSEPVLKLCHIKLDQNIRVDAARRGLISSLFVAIAVRADVGTSRLR